MEVVERPVATIMTELVTEFEAVLTVEGWRPGRLTLKRSVGVYYFVSRLSSPSARRDRCISIRSHEIREKTN